MVSSDCGPGDRALQECNPSTEPSVDCESVPPRFGITPNRGCFPGMPSQPRLKRKTHPLYCRPLGRFHHHFTPELCHTAVFFMGVLVSFSFMFLLWLRFTWCRGG